MHTGTPNIRIPLWTVTDHDLSLSVDMIYSVSDVKLPDVDDGICGVGWFLSSNENKVSREVRGLPDDLYETTGLSRRGWLYQNAVGTTVATDVGNFSASSDLSSSTCTDETSDNTKLASLNYIIDTEPDIFSFNVDGYSGSFVFDNSATPVIRLMPWQDIKITYTTTNNRLASFTIVTNTGKTFMFGAAAENTKSAAIDDGVTAVDILPSEYQFYKNPVVYYYAWGLTKIQSYSGATIDINYNTTQPIKSAQDIRVGIYNQNINAALTKVRVKTLYTVSESIVEKQVALIKASSGDQVVFSFGAGVLQNIAIHDLRRPANDTWVKGFDLAYAIPVANRRKLLSTITETGACQKMKPYGFEYVADEILPPMGNILAKDVWGYYNGKSANEHLVPKLYVYPDEPAQHRVRLYPIPGYTGTQVVLDGADRTPSPQDMAIGTLSGISYPAGGLTYLQYEPNMYYDSRAGKNQYAGGLRIKRITYYDGVSASGSVSKSFDYADPVTGQSFGRVVDFPAFLVPTAKFKDPDYYNNTSYDIAYNASLTKTEQWKRFTSRTEIDLNNAGGPAVRYQYVIVRRPGSGSSKFEFAVPTQYGDAATGQWTPTQNKFARPSTCPDMGILTAGSEWVYPYAPNPSFDLERGLQLHQYEYNESGTLVRQTDNAYQYVYPVGASQPGKVWGIHYDKYAYSSSVFVYGKYFQLTDYARVLSNQTVTTYDVLDQNKSLATSTDFLYESTAHRLLTTTKSTQPGGTVYTTRVKYPLDFGAIPANSEAALLQIKYLQENNRTGEPIETVSYVQKPSDVLRVAGAQLTKYKNFATGVRPSEVLSLRLTAPTNTFQNSGILLQNGTYVLNADPNYATISTITAYNTYGHVVSSVGTNRISKTTAWGYNGANPVVQAINAGDGGNADFAFSDFETTTGFEFSVANGYYGTGRTGANGLHPYATLSKSITKSAGAMNYIVALWLKSDSSTPVVLSVKLEDQTRTTVYYSDTIKVIPVAGAYKFVRKVIPVSSAPATFLIELAGQGLTQPAASAAGLLPLIDDVAAYAEKSALVSYTYELPFGAASATDLRRGVTSFSTYNDLGDPELVLDQDRNILSQNTYSYTKPLSLTADVSTPGAATAEAPKTFYASDNPCVAGESYFWNFGAGFTAGGLTATYTFLHPGIQNIILKVTCPGYADALDTLTLTVQPKVFIPHLCTKGVKEYGCSLISSFSPCSFISDNNATFAYFKVTYEDFIPQSATYQWQMRNVGTDTWLNVTSTVGANADQFNYKVLPNSPSVQIRCMISAAEWATAFTEVETVTVYPCN